MPTQAGLDRVVRRNTEWPSEEHLAEIRQLRARTDREYAEFLNSTTPEERERMPQQERRRIEQRQERLRQERQQQDLLALVAALLGLPER